MSKKRAEEIIAERLLDKLTPDGSRPGKVTIYKPVQVGPQEWHCRYVISGVKDTIVDSAGIGADSVQALSSTFALIGVAFIREPVVGEHGHVAWERAVPSHVDDLVPLPLSSKGLGGADPPPEWLVELDEGVSALRALRDWLEAANETADTRQKIVGLERGMRALQATGKLAVRDADIARVVELQAVLGMPHTGLLPLVEKCLLWWTRTSVAGRGRQAFGRRQSRDLLALLRIEECLAELREHEITPGA